MFTFSIILLYKRRKTIKAEVINSLVLHPVSQSLAANKFQEPNEKLFLCHEIYFKNKKQNKKYPVSVLPVSDKRH